MYGIKAEDVYILWDGIRIMTVQFNKNTPGYRYLERAVWQYGDRLHIESKRRTITTLQGNTETGWIVYGREHGGRELPIVFPSKQMAQDVIDSLKQRVDFK